MKALPIALLMTLFFNVALVRAAPERDPRLCVYAIESLVAIAKASGRLSAEVDALAAAHNQGELRRKWLEAQTAMAELQESKAAVFTHCARGH